MLFMMLGLVLLILLALAVPDKKQSKKQIIKKRAVYVLAGSYRQFKFWCHVNNMWIKYRNIEPIYISGPEILLGVHNIEVVRFGTCGERKDAEKIQDILKLRKYKILTQKDGIRE